MEILDVIKELIQNLGFPIAMVVYFAWRDVKYMTKLDSTLNLIVEYLKREEEK